MALGDPTKFSQDSLKGGTNYQSFPIAPGMSLKTTWIINQPVKKVAKIFFQPVDFYVIILTQLKINEISKRAFNSNCVNFIR